MIAVFNKPKIPSPTFFADIEKNNKNTPDINRIQQFKHQLLFIYSNEMPGHPKYSLLREEGAISMTSAFTVEMFSCWTWKLGLESEAIALRTKFQSAPWTTIKGEVYLVSPDTLIKLDKYKENMIEFNRERVKLNVKYRPERCGYTYSYILRAWMYVGIKDIWDDRINAFNFKSVSTYQPGNTLANKNTLKEAIIMDVEHIPMHDIFKQTGWYRTPEGEWTDRKRPYYMYTPDEYSNK